MAFNRFPRIWVPSPENRDASTPSGDVATYICQCGRHKSIAKVALGCRLGGDASSSTLQEKLADTARFQIRSNSGL